MDLKESASRRRQAQECFVRAAANALDVGIDAGAAAILWGCMGLMHMVASDPSESMLAKVRKVLAQ